MESNSSNDSISRIASAHIFMLRVLRGPRVRLTHCRTHAFVHLEITLDHACRRKARARSFDTNAWIERIDSVNRCCHFAFVVDEKASASMLDDLRQRARRKRDHGRAASEG